MNRSAGTTTHPTTGNVPQTDKNGLRKGDVNAEVHDPVCKEHSTFNVIGKGGFCEAKAKSSKEGTDDTFKTKQAVLETFLSSMGVREGRRKELYAYFWELEPKDQQDILTDPTFGHVFETIKELRTELDKSDSSMEQLQQRFQILNDVYKYSSICTYSELEADDSYEILGAMQRLKPGFDILEKTAKSVTYVGEDVNQLKEKKLFKLFTTLIVLINRTGAQGASAFGFRPLVYKDVINKELFNPNKEPSKIKMSTLLVTQNEEIADGILENNGWNELDKKTFSDSISTWTDNKKAFQTASSHLSGLDDADAARLNLTNVINFWKEETDKFESVINTVRQMSNYVRQLYVAAEVEKKNFSSMEEAQVQSSVVFEIPLLLKEMVDLIMAEKTKVIESKKRMQKASMSRGGSSTLGGGGGREDIKGNKASVLSQLGDTFREREKRPMSEAEKLAKDQAMLAQRKEATRRFEQKQAADAAAREEEEKRKKEEQLAKKQKEERERAEREAQSRKEAQERAAAAKTEADKKAAEEASGSDRKGRGRGEKTACSGRDREETGSLQERE